MKGKLLFKEEQTFVGTWAWYLVLALALFTTISIVINLFQDRETEAYIGLFIGSSVSVGVLLLFLYIRLQVSVDQEFIYYSYRPFVSGVRKLSRQDVKEIYVRKYQPIREYGGWGYRMGFGNGQALNIKGNIGLQIVLKDGNKLLLGTQKGEELSEAVRKLQENWGANV